MNDIITNYYVKLFNDTNHKFRTKNALFLFCKIKFIIGSLKKKNNKVQNEYIKYKEMELMKTLRQLVIMYTEMKARVITNQEGR